MSAQDPNRALDSTTIQELRSRVRGRVLEASHPDYEDA